MITAAATNVFQPETLNLESTPKNDKMKNATKTQNL